ncbi:MAG TPA: tetratricopeptide repeat protein, partial [Ardenticatenaceae bacterium]|nr:tetratricopeptide repeat protein [Ardenticatenaceae bacterium]
VVGWLLRLALFRKPELVVTNFENATGDAELDKVVPGLSQLAREQLVKEIDGVRERVQAKATELGPRDSDPSSQDPLPAGARDQQVAELITSLTAAAPDEFKWVLSLVSVLFRPRGSTVTSTLQRRGSAPGRAGISFQVVDMSGQQDPRLYTVWEPSPPTEAAAQPKTVQAGPAAPPPAPAMQAQPSYQLGTILDRTGRFKEAIGYFEEALQLDKTFDQAADALAGSVSRMQAQARAASNYDTGQKFQEAGLPSRALDSYKRDLPAAETPWAVILKLAPGDEAEAYLALARLYRQDDVCLYDKSLAFYKKAVAAGSAEAAAELQQRQQTEAQTLTQVGRLLHGLAQYGAAEKYLLAALEHVPDDPQAQAALARVRQSMPPQQDTEVLALYTLGTLYEEQGALGEAKTQYEAALTKQPTYDEAKTALKRILDSEWTLAERYGKLLPRAMRWLALELAKRKMMAALPGYLPPSEQQFYRAQVHNFFGVFAVASALNRGDFFYQLALVEYREAIGCSPEWYLPYENLGEAYSYMGRAASGPRALKLQRDSILEYEEALKRVPPDQPAAPVLEASEPPATPSDISEAPTAIATGKDQKKHKLKVFAGAEPVDWPAVRRRIRLGKATSQLLTRSPEQIEAAKREIETVERGWNAGSEKNGRFLYNLASWYAVAESSGAGVPNAKSLARRYLAYSLARQERLWDWSGRDPDLKAIRDGLETLKFALRVKLQELPSLPMLEEDDFTTAMDEVLKQANWT